MVFPDRFEKFPHKAYPRERPPLPQIMFVGVMSKCLQLKRVVPVGDVVTLAICPPHQIKKSIEEPVEDKQHFHLLPEMDLLMSDQLRLIIWLTGYPDKYEERQAGVIIKYLFPGIDLIR